MIKCKDIEVSVIRSKLTIPFSEKRKGIEKLSKEEFCRAILACQNDDLVNEVYQLCLKNYKLMKP